MSREIKFRAWIKDRQFMVDVLSLSLVSGDISHSRLRESYMPIKFEKDNYELMQFTGLKDKNGVEIYEGDIFRDFWGESLVVKFGEHMTSTDYYAAEAYGWYGESVRNNEVTLSLCGGVEVIGNIYENPELLKEEEE